jgi:hypothetical protein
MEFESIRRQAIAERNFTQPLFFHGNSSRKNSVTFDQVDQLKIVADIIGLQISFRRQLVL